MRPTSSSRGRLPAPAPVPPCGPSRARAAAGALALALAPAAGAQAPGLPIAPSAFIRPGLAAALDGGRADGEHAALLAAAYGAGEGRWQLMGGAGILTTATGFRSPALTWGGRLGYRVLGRDRLGVVAFAGLGEARYRIDAPEGSPGGTLVRRQVPLGVAAGYRGTWGAAGSGRAWGLSVAPAWVQQTLRVTDEASLDGSGVRASAVAELALTRRLGISVAYEDGHRARGDEPGPRGAAWGVAVAVAR